MSLIIKKRSDYGIHSHPGVDESPKDSSQEIESCVNELITAIHRKDTKAASRALQSAFAILDAAPHEEGSHPEPHSYEAQNIKAGEQE